MKSSTQLSISHAIEIAVSARASLSTVRHAAQLSDAPLFRWLRRYVHRRIRKEAGDE